MPNYTPAQTAKSWVALIGSAINVTVFGLQESLQFLPPHWALAVNAALGVLTAVAVYLVPNAPATKPPLCPTRPALAPAAAALLLASYGTITRSAPGELRARGGSSGPVGL